MTERRRRPRTAMATSTTAHESPKAISFGKPCGDSHCTPAWIRLTHAGNGLRPQKWRSGLSISRRTAPAMAASVAGRACRPTAPVADAAATRPSRPSRFAYRRKRCLPSMERVCNPNGAPCPAIGATQPRPRMPLPDSAPGDDRSRRRRQHDWSRTSVHSLRQGPAPRRRARASIIRWRITDVAPQSHWRTANEQSRNDHPCRTPFSARAQSGAPRKKPPQVEWSGSR